MKQYTAKKVAAQFLAGEATLEELDDAVYASLEYDRDAEIEKLREEVRSLGREIGATAIGSTARHIEIEARVYNLEYKLSRPWWKKLLGMK